LVRSKRHHLKKVISGVINGLDYRGYILYSFDKHGALFYKFGQVMKAVGYGGLPRINGVAFFFPPFQFQDRFVIFKQEYTAVFQLVLPVLFVIAG
jgi:hypothetical protein